MLWEQVWQILEPFLTLLVAVLYGRWLRQGARAQRALELAQRAMDLLSSLEETQTGQRAPEASRIAVAHRLLVQRGFPSGASHRAVYGAAARLRQPARGDLDA